VFPQFYLCFSIVCPLHACSINFLRSVQRAFSKSAARFFDIFLTNSKLVQGALEFDYPGFFLSAFSSIMLMTPSQACLTLVEDAVPVSHYSTSK
jgi:hypothetical protein